MTVGWRACSCCSPLPAGPWAGSASATLLINEVLAANAGCPEFDDGEVQDPVRPGCTQGGRDVGESGQRAQSDDWVELYNFGGQSVDLSNLYLTNNELYPTRFRLLDAP